MSSETHDIRLKRLKMRCWRRGTKEMDLILGPFADTQLSWLSSEILDVLEELLEENDQDLYLWYAGKQQGPGKYDKAFSAIRQYHDQGFEKI